MNHYNCVEHGVTNSHNPVIGPHCQHEHLCNHKCTNEEKLCHASSERNGSVIHYQDLQQFGCKHTRITYIQKRKVAEKKVHGCVKSGTDPDNHNYAQVPNQSH